MTKENAKKIEDIAFSYLFYNVKENDWPQNPIEILRKAVEEEATADEISDFCEDDQQMIVWYPYDRYSAKFILHEIDRLIENMKQLVEEDNSNSAVQQKRKDETNMSKDVNIVVEYEPLEIRHAVIQCPHCENWFLTEDCTNGFVRHVSDLKKLVFFCPKCGERFSNDVFGLNIEERDYSDFPKTLKKKVVWE